MTIFLEIVKKFLKDETIRLTKSSLKADGYLSNNLLSYVGWGRDPKLSKLKRTFADELLAEVQALQGLDDQETRTRVTELVTQYQGKAKKASVSKGQGEGNFRKGMERALLLVQEIFQELALINLLDTPYDDDPLSQFRYYMGCYFISHVIGSRDPGMVEKAITNPKLTEEKEKATKLALDRCLDDLKTLNEELPDYQTTRARRVIECLERLKLDNQLLCEKYAKKVPLPVEIGFFGKVSVDASALGPTAGLLEFYLNSAIVAIVNRRPSVLDAYPELLIRHREILRTHVGILKISEGFLKAHPELLQALPELLEFHPGLLDNRVRHAAANVMAQA